MLGSPMLGLMLALALSLSVEPNRIECSSPSLSIDPQPNHATSLTCGGHSGFFVHSERYRSIDGAAAAGPLLRSQVELQKKQIKHLKAALLSKTETASSAMKAAAFYQSAYEAERIAHQEAEADARDGLGVERLLWLVAGGGMVFLGTLK